MNWRDFLYFSKGERRALVVLLLLVAGAGMWLVIADRRKGETVAETTPRYIVQPENAPLPIAFDAATTPASPSPSPSPSRREITARRHPSLPSLPRTEKFPVGTRVELNTADTTTLKKVPGIGSAFAGRIVKYRALLGGFYTVGQLREVYGMDEARYQSLQSWFYADTAFIAKLPVNHLPVDRMARHPYISYPQARAIGQLSRRKGRLNGWEHLRLLEEFTEADRARLSPYLSFH
jgi:competence ComEA-like helix-hairpin-helix protein